MSVGPVTPTKEDYRVRTHTAYDLEVTLVEFVGKIVAPYRLDNPTLNLAQPEEVPYDYTERAQTLYLKTVPQVVRGRIPRTVTGEIAIDRLPDYPAIVIQAIAGHVETDFTTVTVRLLVNVYDENPDSGGYQDALNLTETIAIAFTRYGQAAIDKAYPIILPLDWRMIEAETFPHYVSEMTSAWELPSTSPAIERTTWDPYVPDKLKSTHHQR